MAYYRVRRGDSPTSVAQMYGMTQEQLLRLNPGAIPFATGQRIKLGANVLGRLSVPSPNPNYSAPTRFKPGMGPSSGEGQTGIRGAVPGGLKVLASLRPGGIGLMGNVSGQAGQAQYMLRPGPVSANQAGLPAPGQTGTVLPGTLNINTPTLSNPQGQRPPAGGQTALQILGLQRSGETDAANTYDPTRASQRPYAEYGGDTSAQIMNQVSAQLAQGNFPGRLPIAQASSLGLVQQFLNAGYRIESGALIAPEGGVQQPEFVPTSSNYGHGSDQYGRPLDRFGKPIGALRNRKGSLIRRGGGGGNQQQAQVPNGFGLVNLTWNV